MSILDRISRKFGSSNSSQTLEGRSEAMTGIGVHTVLNTPLKGPFPQNARKAMFGLGCFWGAERVFWQLPGVIVTAVGYAGGTTPNPTYGEVCSGRTGHNEVVQVIYDPAIISYDTLLKTFWEAHDPTQGMRQGNDVGTQYRSGIYVYDEDQHQRADASKRDYGQALMTSGRGEITTEIVTAPEFYFAEDYHQQYLDKNPRGYCGLGGTGISCPLPAANGTKAEIEK